MNLIIEKNQLITILIIDLYKIRQFKDLHSNNLFHK